MYLKFLEKNFLNSPNSGTYEKCKFTQIHPPVCPNAQKTQIFHTKGDGFRHLALQYTVNRKAHTLRPQSVVRMSLSRLMQQL